jgi:predicted acetyltransferase
VESRVRTIASDDDIAAYLRCMRTAFLDGKDITAEMVAYVRDRWDLSRTWGAFDEGELCGTTRTFPSRLRLPGLGDVPVSCLTQVTVLPTHTRQGHLTRMMRTQLEAAVEAGEVASLLVAAEWPIYGRFGYGPYCEWVQWQVDTDLAQVVGEPVGRCRIVDASTLEKAASTVLARHQARTPGAIERPDWLLARRVGTDLPPGEDRKESRVYVVHEGTDDEPDGFTYYEPKERWEGMRSASTIEVQELVATSPEAERELWRYLLDVDLVSMVQVDGDPASAIRHVVRDGRAARQTGRWDHIWARILDVPAALEARSYARSDRLVLEVIDGFCGRGGRFVLDASPDGASCVPAGGEAADVTLPVAALGAAWVGGTDLRAIAAGGGVDEHASGAVERLAALLSWHQVPDCPTDF